MRITSGILRGRTMKAPPGIRPTQDMVRQALFSSLGDRVAGARALDLFAGSGALGLEAWSRGAAAVCWVENNARAFAVLRANVEHLCRDGGETKCVRQDVFRFLKSGEASGPFDVILADPPYGLAGALEMTLNRVRSRLILSANGVVVFEQSARAPAPACEGWALRGEKTYGETRLLFFQPDT
jgi:16S rRNA (guanine966-N2)-methyltransferase